MVALAQRHKRQAVNLVQVDALARCQRAFPRNVHRVSGVHQLERFKPGKILGMRAEDGDFRIARLNHAQRTHRVNLLEAHLRTGVALHKLHYEIVGEWVNRPLAQGNLERLVMRSTAIPPFNVLIHCKQGRYVTEERLAVGSKAHATMVGLKQAHPRFILKAAHGLAQSLPRDVESLGSLVEAANTRHLGKPLHLADVHRSPNPVQPARLLRSSLVTPSCTPVQG